MLRVLVVDDSPVARDLLMEILSADPGIEVAGSAQDGVEAVEMVRELKPDVVTMDVQMPRMNGYDATEEIMVMQPTPIVVVSGSMSSPDVDKSMNSLRAGALTVIGKPSSPQSPNFEQSAKILLDTVKSMSDVKVVRRTRREIDSSRQKQSPTLSRSLQDAAANIVAIAASTGGPAVLQHIFSKLPANYPLPILVVQHIAEGFIDGFATWLDHIVSPRVQLAERGTPLKAGTIYIAPEGMHLGVTTDWRADLIDRPPIEGFRPSATVLYESIAKAHGELALAIILTGMGHDGTEGLRSIRQMNGRIIAQDEESSVVFGMPKSAINAGLTDAVLNPDEISDYLTTRLRFEQ